VLVVGVSLLVLAGGWGWLVADASSEESGGAFVSLPSTTVLAPPGPEGAGGGGVGTGVLGIAPTSTQVL
jgi:hypothetical protein